MDFLVGGVPRGGTTVAAKFLSLHRDMFCYAGETHIVPLLHELFGQHPCAPAKIDTCIEFLRQQFMTTMVTMPRFSVSRGAHPANLIFDEQAVEDVLAFVRGRLAEGRCGQDLYHDALDLLSTLLAARDPRPLRGEKTPSNVFALAEYGGPGGPAPVVVLREPLGVVRSMRCRQDQFAGPFSGEIENCIGLYLEYVDACLRCLKQPGATLVRYEEMADDPAEVLRRAYALFGREPEERVVRFVEKGGDKEVADRAPMNYRRLTYSPKLEGIRGLDAWKIAELTRSVREAAGYDDACLARIGYPLAEHCPVAEVPTLVTPLGGFHKCESESHVWMKRQGRLAVYLPRTAKAVVRLSFWSNFPEEICGGRDITLSLLVDGAPREQVRVPAGQAATRLKTTLSGADLRPMGEAGSFAVLELRSSLAYAPIAVLDNTTDHRVVSFVFTGWKVKV